MWEYVWDLLKAISIACILYRNTNYSVFTARQEHTLYRNYYSLCVVSWDSGLTWNQSNWLTSCATPDFWRNISAANPCVTVSYTRSEVHYQSTPSTWRISAVKNSYEGTTPFHCANRVVTPKPDSVYGSWVVHPHQFIAFNMTSEHCWRTATDVDVVSTVQFQNQSSW